MTKHCSKKTRYRRPGLDDKSLTWFVFIQLHEREVDYRVINEQGVIISDFFRRLWYTYILMYCICDSYCNVCMYYEISKQQLTAK